MKLVKLKVENFRNLDSIPIEFRPGINCIIGENGHGKTNLLEAIYYLAFKKSFRKNASFPQFVSIDGDKLEIYFSSVWDDLSKGTLLSYSGKIFPNGSLWFEQGRAVKKSPQIPIVFIGPFDAHMFAQSPSHRRKWFDQKLSLIDRSYKKELNRYQAILKQRNFLLSKRPGKFKEQIYSLDKEMAISSCHLTSKRCEFLNSLVPLFPKIFNELFSQHFQIEIHLKESFAGLSQDEIFTILQDTLSEDLRKGITSIGIHKNDYELLFDGFDWLDFCSVGQQKMIYLSLIFAYVELFSYKFNAYPIVLIDDISGELDAWRWDNLVSFLEKRQFQVLITTANENFKKKLQKIESAGELYVNEGQIRSIP